MYWRGGKYITSSCPMTDKPTATQKTRLVVKPTSNIDLSCDLELSALNMSKKTKVVKVMVVSRAVTFPSSMVDLRTHMVPVVMKNADVTMLVIKDLVRICSCAFLGGFLSTL